MTEENKEKSNDNTKRRGMKGQETKVKRIERRVMTRIKRKIMTIERGKEKKR